MSEKINAIDKAINAAKARKAAKAGATESTETTVKASKPAKAKEPTETKPKRARVSEEEKAARKAKLETERAEKKALREAARAEKKAAREASRKPAHMSKVAKAAERLPLMGDAALMYFNEVTANLTVGDVAALAAHLGHFNRVKATERALTQKLAVGDTVRIVSGASQFLGKEGTVTKAQRIRCYVDVGAKRPVYLFTSDVEVLASALVTATGTEG